MYISAVDRSVGEEEWRPFVERQGSVIWSLPVGVVTCRW